MGKGKRMKMSKSIAALEPLEELIANSGLTNKWLAEKFIKDKNPRVILSHWVKHEPEYIEMVQFLINREAE